MSPKIVRRGFEPEDERFFSTDAVKELSRIQGELQWLLDHDYPMHSSIEFVGNRYRLSARQRIALRRVSGSANQYEQRKKKQLPMNHLSEGTLNIDGFNLIIPLEVALSGSILILGNDEVIRDLAGLRGTYRIIDKTYTAIDMIGDYLKRHNVPAVRFYLDAPVSNSGRLMQLILEKSKDWHIDTEVMLVTNPDTILSDMDRVVTGDSVIIDKCDSWFNLAKNIIDDYIQEAWIVQFTESKE